MMIPVAWNVTFCDANGVRKDRPNGGLYVNETKQSNTLSGSGDGGTYIAAALTANYGKQLDNSDRNGGPPNLIIAAYKKRGGFGWSENGDQSPTLESEGGTHQGGPERIPLVVNAFNGYTGGADDNDAQAGHIIAFDPFMAGSDRSFIHRKNGKAQLSGREDAVAGSFGVRRLMPIECERLQGFPDGWTNEPPQSDSVRYRQLGNAVAVPVAEWIGRRIAAVEAQR